MTQGDRLKEFINAAFGGTVSAAAAAMGVNRTMLYQYIRGVAEPGKVLLDKLAEVGANPLWIARGEGEMFADNEAGRELRDKVGTKQGHVVRRKKSKGTVEREIEIHHYRLREDIDGLRVMPTKQLVPLMLVPASAGTGQPPDEHIQEWLDLDEYLAPKPEEVFCVRARGRSMLYDGIRDGDLLVVERTPEPKHGDVIVATLNGTVVVKRLEYHGRGVGLMPANEEFTPVSLKPSDKLKVWGVVRKVVHDM